MTFTDRHYPPEDIALTNPVRVTITDHGLSSGQRLRATDFNGPLSELPTGMQQLNNQLFKINVVSNSAFDLYDILGVPIDGTAYTPLTGDGTPEFTLTGPELFVENTA